MRPQVHSLWQSQVHVGIYNWYGFLVAEAATTKCRDFYESPAGWATMTPRGQVGCGQQQVMQYVRT